LHVANLIVGHREIALPARIAGVGFRVAGDNVSFGLVGLQRGAEIPLLHLNVADPFVADPEIILPFGIAGAGFR
jgi:hypothetical protein